jgi:hypothetical protein
VQIVWWYSCPLNFTRMYLYVYSSLYGIFKVNTGTFDKNKGTWKSWVDLVLGRFESICGPWTANGLMGRST